MPYRAPVNDLLRSMHVAIGMRAGSFPELEDGTAAAILSEAAAFAEGVLAPIDRTGDIEGLSYADGKVHTAPGWIEAYRAWIAGGWNAVSAPAHAGGMGLPLLLQCACAEIWSGANMAFALAPVLNVGAIEALERHGSPDLKERFLPKLVSGEWTGTMNLTEPQAGSDLGGLATRATRRSDGTYAITGQKIYISYGEHDLTDNILHLVLARLPDAPPGHRGISLFLVPKVLVGPDGSLGGANDLRCTGIERKLGMHAAPTCTMVFGDGGGATGFLIGEENKGLACMFTMMNNARLAVGVEGVAAAEHATQTALSFARERRQGRSSPGSTAMSPIIEHPDVTRMLMTMRALTAAARAICHLTAASLDAARQEEDPGIRKAALDRAALLTPIAKAFSTDIANAVASLGVQVHGGMGYVEDSGAAQIMRDARILAIYEGTNGIQAIDLATRKLPLDDGGIVVREIADMRRIAETLRASNAGGFGGTRDALTAAIDALERASLDLLSKLTQQGPAVLAVASPYLELFGLARGASSLVAIALDQSGGDARKSVALARFFAENILPAAAGLEVIVLGGGAALSDDQDVWVAALLEDG